MCPQYLSTRFTNNSDHVLLFKAYVGTQAEMAGKDIFPVPNSRRQRWPRHFLILLALGESKEYPKTWALRAHLMLLSVLGKGYYI